MSWFVLQFCNRPAVPGVAAAACSIFPGRLKHTPEAKNLTGQVDWSHPLRMSNDAPSVAAVAVSVNPHAADIVGQAAVDSASVDVKTVSVLADNGIDSFLNSITDDSFDGGLFHAVPLSGLSP